MSRRNQQGAVPFNAQLEPNPRPAWVTLFSPGTGQVGWSPSPLSADAHLQGSTDGGNTWSDIDVFAGGTPSPSDPDIYDKQLARMVRDSDGATSNATTIS